MIDLLKKILHLDRDWRNLNALPKEVLSNRKLNQMEKKVVRELKKIQDQEIDKHHLPHSAKPQALYYYHKYIDAKFSKRNFDVDTLFNQKQSIIDQKYAEGLGELHDEITGYRELIAEIREAEKRMHRRMSVLDPDSSLDTNNDGTYDDSDDLLDQIQALPREINWKNLQTEIKNETRK